MNGKWTQGLAGLLAAVLLMPTPAALAAEIGGVEDSPTGSASNAATVDIANGSGSKVQFEPNGEVELTDGKSASFTLVTAVSYTHLDVYKRQVSTYSALEYAALRS